MNVYGVDLVEDGDRVVRNFKKDGAFEPDSVMFWNLSVRRGQVAIDVGSYSGLYALLAADQGAIAVAYEPNPLMVERLRCNAALNRLPVEIHPHAVSDKIERRPLWMRHGMTSAGRFKERAGAHSVDVDCVVLREPRRVCAIKIDVEGAELAVLRGAVDLIKRDYPAVIAEALSERAAQQLEDFMAALGYGCRRADKHNLLFLRA